LSVLELLLVCQMTEVQFLIKVKLVKYFEYLVIFINTQLSVLFSCFAR